jgi:hypothetical protein
MTSLPSLKAPGFFTSLFERAVTRFRDRDESVSGTKIVWLSNGMLSCYCATLATVGAVSVWVFNHKADTAYLAFCTGLWTISLGFAGSVKKSQNQATKEITLASQQAAQAGTEDKGGAS